MAVAAGSSVGSVMMRAGRTVITAVGVFTVLTLLVPPCPCAEPVRSAEFHDCCAPPLGVRAADHRCCSNPGDASLVVSVPSSPIMPPASAAFVPRAEEVLAGAASSALPGSPPTLSPPAILRI
jgi:hypothetical protein